MKNSSLLIFLSSLLLIFGGIQVADRLGYWQTTSSGGLSKTSVASFVSPEEIRGSTTFGEIEEVFSIPSLLLARAYHFDVQTPSLLKAMDVEPAFSHLGDDIELGTGSVKLFVHLFVGTPIDDILELENLPSTAVEVLKEEGKWSGILETQLADYIIAVGPSPTRDQDLERLLEEEQQETPTATEPGSPLEINGKTTFQEIIDAGLSLDTIEDTLGFDVPNTHLGFRDLCEKNDLTFSTAKNQVLELLEKSQP